MLGEWSGVEEEEPVECTRDSRLDDALPRRLLGSVEEEEEA